MRCYVMVSPALMNAAESKEVIKFVDSIPEVENWRYTHGALLMATDITVSALSARVRKRFPDLRHIIFRVETAQGWADEETWDFINFPRPVGAPKPE